MFISSEQKGRVYNPKPNPRKDKIYMSNISTYEGLDEFGDRKYCNWICNYVGSAFEKAKKLKHRDDIKLTDATIERYYNKKTDKVRDSITVYDFEILEKFNND